MKRRITLVLALLVCTLLLASATVAQGGGSGPDNTTTLSGGHYRLVSPGVGVDIVASGGGYTLLRPAASTLQGSGCCCTYLPCVLRKY
jgi:hypothetical protein